jgi:methionyl aminopeptidase
VEKNHCSVVREYCGHGIGKQFHEEPQVLHYGSPNSGEVLQPGMTFTIEPMVNAGKRHVRLLPDKWTGRDLKTIVYLHSGNILTRY